LHVLTHRAGGAKGGTGGRGGGGLLGGGFGLGGEDGGKKIATAARSSPVVTRVTVMLTNPRSVDKRVML
jgi:hypothetical protein